jgi:hypothetical protein
MSEVELHTMRNRLDRGRMNKAQRGEMFHGVPMGYVILPNDEVAFDPDEQARTVMQIVFDKFDEIGAIYGLMHDLVRNRIALPVRLRSGPKKASWSGGVRRCRRCANCCITRSTQAPTCMAGVHAIPKPSTPRTGIEAENGSRWRNGKYLLRINCPPTSPGTATSRTKNVCGKTCAARQRQVRRAKAHRC